MISKDNICFCCMKCVLATLLFDPLNFPSLNPSLFSVYLRRCSDILGLYKGMIILPSLLSIPFLILIYFWPFKNISGTLCQRHHWTVYHCSKIFYPQCLIVTCDPINLLGLLTPTYITLTNRFSHKLNPLTSSRFHRRLVSFLNLKKKTQFANQMWDFRNLRATNYYYC